MSPKTTATSTTKTFISRIIKAVRRLSTGEGRNHGAGRSAAPKPASPPARRYAMRRIRSVILLIFAGFCAQILAQSLGSTPSQPQTPEDLNAPAPNGVRPGGTLADEFASPPIPAEVKSMARPERNYPEQPPVVPHNIRDYQIDKNFNKCLTCHSRSVTEISGAPMVSVTHYRDRDGQVLAAVSPRRYFCLQCHVPQQQITPIRGNTFKGIDEVLQEVIIEQQRQKETWRSHVQ